MLIRAAALAASEPILDMLDGVRLPSPVEHFTISDLEVRE